MSFRKRKRRSKDIKCILFPDDVESSFQRAGREPLSSASTARSWHRCGDSFLDSPVLKNLGRKVSTIKELVLSPTPAPTAGASQGGEDIAWSSSDSQQSEDEDQERRSFRAAARQPQPRRARTHAASVRPSAPSHASHADDVPVIDTDSDSEEPEPVEADSGQRISDSDSESGRENPKPDPTTHKAELEASAPVSEGESGGGGRAVPTGSSGRRSLSSWVRSAQALLQTPQKAPDRQPKTPEDSGKKKRKFQSGGLAERLSRLQSRQRSAVSFWRHQSLSHAPADTADRPDVLVLEVLEVQEECSMRVARCERRRPRAPGSQSEASAGVLVLFSRETVAQLMPAPKDVIHVYPPWQSLSIEGFSSSVVLNTHLSQKVRSAPHPPGSPSAGRLATERRRPYSLCQTFGALEAPGTSGENGAKQVARLEVLSALEGPGPLSSHSLSLLEAVEGLGQAGSVGQDVEVVVQRVYAVAAAESPAPPLLKPRVHSRSSRPQPSPEKGDARLCVLVQDTYGTFSVVQLHLLARTDDLHRYGHAWRGRTCLLRGVKVVRRVTRARCSRLFSLIDSLWPPVAPLRDHRNPSSSSSGTRAAGPAPSFCYLLSGEEGSVQPSEGCPPSPLYFPPTAQTLRDILQTELKSFRCSFVATVIYKRLTQGGGGGGGGRGEVWLALTDRSLQEDAPERPRRRTLALCVSAACVLTSSVVRALGAPPPGGGCRLSFTDVVREHGLLLCVEQSAVEVCAPDPERIAEPPVGSGPPAEPPAPPRPLRLDPLSPEVTPNSLCSVTGVIVGVDEDSAFSWPVCSRCGSDHLEVLPGRRFHCGSCQAVVDKPETRIQLEVFLSSSWAGCTLKVKLQQKTIASILDAAALQGDDFAGLHVDAVLGRELGPLAVCVRALGGTPVLRMSLEEVDLGGPQES